MACSVAQQEDREHASTVEGSVRRRALSVLIDGEADAKQRDRYRVVLIAGEGMADQGELRREQIATVVAARGTREAEGRHPAGRDGAEGVHGRHKRRSKGWWLERVPRRVPAAVRRRVRGVPGYRRRHPARHLRDPRLECACELPEQVRGGSPEERLSWRRLLHGYSVLAA
jgi:hypothetical protein